MNIISCWYVWGFVFPHENHWQQEAWDYPCFDNNSQSLHVVLLQHLTFYLFGSLQENTHGASIPTYTHTHMQEIQFMDSISSSVLYSLTYTHMNLVFSLLYFFAMVIITLWDSGSLSRAWFTTAVQRWRHIIHQLPVKPVVLKQLVNDFCSLPFNQHIWISGIRWDKNTVNIGLSFIFDAIESYAMHIKAPMLSHTCAYNFLLQIPLLCKSSSNEIRPISVAWHWY